MEQSPEISVVIPVYNCEKYVGEAIESVLNQPYQNILLVLVDDGSTDDSPEICDSYAHAHDRITVIHQKNGGVSAARNAGIEYVLAENLNTAYIAFLDADDRWQADFYNAETVSLISKDFDLLGFQSCNCNSTATRRNQPRSMEEGICSGEADSVWKHSSQHFASMLYSANLIRNYQIRFQFGLKYGEDNIFRMQCIYLAKNLELHNRLMYLYRHSGTSAVHGRKYGISYFVPIIDGWLQSDKSMEAYQSESRAPLWEGRAMAAVCIVDMVEEHYQHFGRSRALKQIFENHPEYLELITGSFACNRSDSGLRWKNAKAHPFGFRLKCYAKGMTKTLLRMVYLHLYQIRAISKLIDKKRYPVEL